MALISGAPLTVPAGWKGGLEQVQIVLVCCQQTLHLRLTIVA